MSTESELRDIVRDADVLIGYSPIGDEPDVGEFFHARGILARGMSLLPAHDISPHATAESLSALHRGKSVVVFVPGRRFDSSGVRHGRGGGWYDRFLSNIPHEWVRVGVLHTSHMSDTPLVRQAWDEPVDFLIIKNGGWSVVTTGARAP